MQVVAFEGCKYSEQKMTKKGVKPKTSIQVPCGGYCYRFGTVQAKIERVKPSACNVCSHVAVCLGKAASVLRPSYNRKGKSLLRHITPSESLLSVFINWGMNKHTQAVSRAHNQTFLRWRSCLIQAQYSLLFFNPCKKKKKSSLKPFDCMANPKY